MASAVDSLLFGQRQNLCQVANGSQNSLKMNASRYNQHRGFTLIEMTLALALSLGIAASVVALLQQQVSFTQIIGRFQFLREEAPQINTLLASLLSDADSYRIYPSRANAVSGMAPVTSNGRALRLRLRNPDGTANYAIIAFETMDGNSRLNFYYRSTDDSSWSSTPSWTISSRPSLVDFSNNTGILLIAMTGPNGEEITYAGNPN